MRRLVVFPVSREELGGRFLGPMAYLDLKGEGDHSMPLKRRPCSGVGGGASRDPRDRAKAGLPESQSPGDGRSHPPEMTPGASAVPCPGFVPWPGQPPGRGAMPSEGIKGDVVNRNAEGGSKWLADCGAARVDGGSSGPPGVALRGGGLKPLTGALAEDRGAERCEERRDLIASGADREDVRWAESGPLPSEASKRIEMTSKPGSCLCSGMNLGGVRADGGVARTGGAARPGRRAGGALGAGQAGGGRRPRGDAKPTRSGWCRPIRHPRSAWSGRRWTRPGGSGSATTPHPGTPSPSGRSIRCGCWSPTGIPTWRRTAIWPAPSGTSGWTGSRRSGCSTNPRRPRCGWTPTSRSGSSTRTRRSRR